MPAQHRAPARRNLALAALLLTSSGCAAQEQDTRKRLHELQSDLDGLRQQNLQLLERVSALEVEQETGHTRGNTSSSVPTPTLRVVRLEPGSTLPTATPASTPEPPGSPTPADTAELGEPRPVIHVEGNVVLETGGSGAP